LTNIFLTAQHTWSWHKATGLRRFWP